jgi:hypothetical protein
MRLKKNKDVKKYITGGAIASIGSSILGAGLGLSQFVQGKTAAARIKEAPTARPSEYAEMLKEARGADLEQRRLEELNRTISTGISAAQQGGGRTLLAALPQMVQAADAGAINIASKRQDDTMQALQFAAQGKEAEIGRKFQREMMQRDAAQSAIEGGLQNIAGGLGQLGTAAVYGVFDKKAGGDPTAAPTTPGDLKKSVMGGKFGSPEAGMFAEEKLNPFMAEEGGMMTKGKFDHKTNPIDIIRGGKKIGEMTGGEVVLNPSQQKKLSKESAYFRSLLKKFNKQK